MSEKTRKCILWMDNDATPYRAPQLLFGQGRYLYVKRTGRLSQKHTLSKVLGTWNNKEVALHRDQGVPVLNVTHVIERTIALRCTVGRLNRRLQTIAHMRSVRAGEWGVELSPRIC